MPDRRLAIVSFHSLFIYSSFDKMSETKKNVLLSLHSLSSLIHVAMFYFLLVQWSKADNPVLTHFQIFCLVIIGIGFLIILILIFSIFKSEMKSDSHARRFFHIWPLVHIALSTAYQLFTQIVISHWKTYQIPILYSSYATTVSVCIHLVLHSMAVFWKV
ncbi:MiRP K channel accessory Subunit [Caenorhabditis elegans]|uniref:MiRP K channel accessory Subunit n=1 Tax=Caenorhabditis elegans TaxID=6239 RepID=Q9TZ55_CAEEL|nr:MiRP K channel accessory Subunit [Caenorhabditis elegans]CCD61957.1 MiRP K channel accessory Subunit [Caenorhabditis elegans]|eukprot:NP_493704.1 MiRP K channel accessory Subunit [Caenorhabditis elegans]